MDFIKHVLDSEKVPKLAETSKDEYFPEVFSRIRDHYYGQGKFKDFVKFLVDLGLSARESDKKFLESLRRKGDTAIIHYGEMCLAAMHKGTKGKKPMKRVLKATKEHIAISQMKKMGTKINIKSIKNPSPKAIDYMSRFFRVYGNYRICNLQHLSMLKDTTIYPIFYELIYSIAEDLAEEKDLVESFTEILRKTVLSDEDRATVEVFCSIKDLAMKLLQKKEIKLVFILPSGKSAPSQIDFTNLLKEERDIIHIEI